MSFQSDIYTAITGNGTVAGLVGTSIFPDVADGTVSAPFIVYQVVSTDGETTHDGVRNIEFPLVQFSCWSTTKASAISLAAAVNDVLDGKTISGTANASFTFSNQFGNYDSESKLFGEILEYRAAANTN